MIEQMSVPMSRKGRKNKQVCREQRRQQQREAIERSLHEREAYHYGQLMNLSKALKNLRVQWSDHLNYLAEEFELWDASFNVFTESLHQAEKLLFSLLPRQTQLAKKKKVRTIPMAPRQPKQLPQPKPPVYADVIMEEVTHRSSKIK